MATQQDQIQSMQSQMQSMQSQMQSMQMENAMLRQQVEATAIAATSSQQTLHLVGEQTKQMKELVQEVRSMKKTSRETTLVDAKGLGKPLVFQNDQEKFTAWSRKTENYIVGIFGEEFRAVLEWAVGCEAEIHEVDWHAALGDEADEIDKIEDLNHKTHQVYQALMALTEDESQDIVIGAGAGNGLDAWRKLGRRWDPIVAGRKRALLKQIISPEKCKMEELIGVWERWEEQVRKYEKRKDEKGERLKLDTELKMTAFELLLPADLENHLILNKKRLTTYEMQKDEINGILESRIGTRIRELQIRQKSGRDPNAMDIDAFGKGKGKDRGKGFGKGAAGKGSCKGKGFGKGKGKTDKGSSGQGGAGGGKGSGTYSSGTFQGYCDGCHKWGHKVADCWGKNTAKGYGKDRGGAGRFGSKGNKGKKGKGKGFAAFDEGGEDEESQGFAGGCASSFEYDLGPFEPAGFAGGPASSDCAGNEVSALTPGKEVWVKMNYDTGAAITAFPKDFAPSAVQGNGCKYKTATGELTEDQGALRITGEDEGRSLRRLTGRLTDVHKPLVSASSCASHGQNGWVSKGGGWLIPENSATSWKIQKILAKDAAKKAHKMIPLYEERGVYNFYVKANTRRGKIEVLEGQQEADVKSLSKEALEKEVLRLRGPSGFTRQPGA